MHRLTLFFLLVSVFTCAQSAAPKCAAGEHHQLDFWAGSWDVFEVDGTHPVAHATISRALDGCALHERYDQRDGLQGESFSAYDVGRKLWRQSWYTNRGKGLELTGKMQGESLILEGMDHSTDSMVRVTWKPVKGGVQETAVISADHGNTWKTWFDMIFRAPSRSAAAERGSNQSNWFNDRYTRAPSDWRYSLYNDQADAAKAR